jgi:hypothetical protein
MREIGTQFVVSIYTLFLSPFQKVDYGLLRTHLLEP